MFPGHCERVARSSPCSHPASGVPAPEHSLQDLLSMPKVVIVNEKKEIDVPQGANLRKSVREAGVEVHGTVETYLNCMGNGLCGTCRVLVKKGMENLNPKTTMEKINFA